jgi:hypothetical protein
MSKMLKTLTITALFGASIQAQAFDAMQCVYREGAIRNLANPLTVPDVTRFYVYQKEIDPKAEKTVLIMEDSLFAAELVSKNKNLDLIIRYGSGFGTNDYNRLIRDIWEQKKYSETRQTLVFDDYKDKVSSEVRLSSHESGTWSRNVCYLCTKGSSCLTEARYRSIAEQRKERFMSFKSYKADENNPDPL